jgi:predicted glycoside hydrolase/deacetylase ChbG (UPF0249 family)
MDTPLVVINADDLGFAADINAAIEELHRAGIITNATLMVDGPFVEEAVAIARRNPRLGVGLHLDLCPVVGLYSLPYDKMREGLSAPAMLSKVAEETERQITRFKQFGLDFSHMDSHRHFHALPELFTLVIEVAARHGLQSVRLTKDWILPRTPSVYWSEEFFMEAKTSLRRHGASHPDNFVYGWRDYSAADFKPGLNELMVHVGSADAEYLREYRHLSSPEFRRSLEDAQADLRSYPGSINRAHSSRRA